MTTPGFHASVGIIGGADGPTVVFITGNPATLILAAVSLIAATALVILLTRKNKFQLHTQCPPCAGHYLLISLQTQRQPGSACVDRNLSP